MTTIILGTPSPTGPLEDLADRLRQSGAPGSRTGQDRDGARASLTDRKDGNLEVTAVPGVCWPAGGPGTPGSPSLPRQGRAAVGGEAKATALAATENRELAIERGRPFGAGPAFCVSEPGEKESG